MPTDPRRLAVLLAVHRAGGVLAAADLLHVTPSAVSQQIARLEAEEGVPVLDRGPRGATLTAAGRILAEAAERIESELVEARKSLAALGGELSGRVTVAGFQTAIRAVVAPTFAVVAERHPGIELVVEERDPGESMRRLREGDADVVLLATEWAEYRELDPQELGAVVHQKAMLDGRNVLDPARWRAAGWTYRALGRP